MPIDGRIIRVLGPTEVVLNVGASDGVRSGMTFVIYTMGEVITDPLTGEDIQRLEIVKGRVIAREVETDGIVLLVVEGVPVHPESRHDGVRGAKQRLR